MYSCKNEPLLDASDDGPMPVSSGQLTLDGRSQDAHLLRKRRIISICLKLVYTSAMGTTFYLMSFSTHPGMHASSSSKVVRLDEILNQHRGYGSGKEVMEKGQSIKIPGLSEANTWPLDQLRSLVPSWVLSIIPACLRGFILLLALVNSAHKCHGKLMPSAIRSSVWSVLDNLCPEYMIRGAPVMFRQLPKGARDSIRKELAKYRGQELIEQLNRYRFDFTEEEIHSLDDWFHGEVQNRDVDGVSIARSEGWAVYQERVADTEHGWKVRLFCFHHIFAGCYLWAIFACWPHLNNEQRFYFLVISFKVSVYLVLCWICSYLRPWFLAIDPLVCGTEGTVSSWLILVTFILAPEAYPIVEVVDNFGQIPRRMYTMLLSFTDLLGFLQAFRLMTDPPDMDCSSQRSLVVLTLGFSISLPLGCALLFLGKERVCTLRTKKKEVMVELSSFIISVLMLIVVWSAFNNSCPECNDVVNHHITWNAEAHTCGPPTIVKRLMGEGPICQLVCRQGYRGDPSPSVFQCNANYTCHLPDTDTGCQETCSRYSCTTNGWVRKSGVEDQTNPDESTCCEATCSSYSCTTSGWVTKSGVEFQTNPDDSTYCEPFVRAIRA